MTCPPGTPGWQAAASALQLGKSWGRGKLGPQVRWAFVSGEEAWQPRPAVGGAGAGVLQTGVHRGRRREARRGGDLQGRQFCEYPENLKVTFRSICTRGCWASLPALGGGSNTPQAEIRAPGQAQPSLCPGQPGEGCHPAEDRWWSFVLISGSGALRYLQALARGAGGMRPLT